MSMVSDIFIEQEHEDKIELLKWIRDSEIRLDGLSDEELEEIVQMFENEEVDESEVN